MDSIDQARARLEQALDRLEAAAGRAGGASADGGDPALQDELAAVKADRDRLSAALAEVQQKYADLRAVSEAISARLDSTIGRVRKLMED